MIDWPWITGKIITATGWTFDQLGESSFSDVADLLEYWIEEPPEHVILALRYLGPGKRGKKIDEAQARKDMGEMSRIMGAPAQPLPANLKEMIRSAEQLKQKNRGL